MTRETRQYLSRIRKAQDAILNGKVRDKSASLDMQCRLSCNENKKPLITVYANTVVNGKQVCKCAYIWPWFSSEDIETELIECSNLIGYPI